VKRIVPALLGSELLFDVITHERAIFESYDQTNAEKAFERRDSFLSRQKTIQ